MRLFCYVFEKTELLLCLASYKHETLTIINDDIVNLEKIRAKDAVDLFDLHFLVGAIDMREVDSRYEVFRDVQLADRKFFECTRVGLHHGTMETGSLLLEDLHLSGQFCLVEAFVYYRF